MKKKTVKTSDGSLTLFDEVYHESFHSNHGALQEAMHVFIREGLFYRADDIDELSILEVGFGTGLNALLTLSHAEKLKKQIHYQAIEAHPLEWSLVKSLDYESLTGVQSRIFQLMHTCDWGRSIEINSWFNLKKLHTKLQDFSATNAFDLIYFDAFSPTHQPELWTEDIFKKMYKALKPSGVLVTYCAKGSVKRAIKFVGFELYSLPGPPGKREMTRAVKLAV